MIKVNLEEVEINEVSIRFVLLKLCILDLFNLYKRGEDDVVVIVIFCLKYILIFFLENLLKYGFILYDVIKYGCKKFFYVIMVYFEVDDEKICCVLKFEVKGLIFLVVVVCNFQLIIVENIFKYDDGIIWVMEKLVKNILYFVIYIQDFKMIEFVGLKIYGKLCGMKDSCGLILEVYMCFFGF